MKEYVVAILGATGAVGQRLISELEHAQIPVKEVKLLASKNSAGKKLKFKNQEIKVEEARPDSFNGVDLVLSSAGGAVSQKLLPEAVKRGAVCVDNTSAFRMADDVPLIVPGVNDDQLVNHHGIIANPNCSTIQMVAALYPLHVKWGIKQIIVSTYQAVSGAGKAARDELLQQAQDRLNNQETEAKILPTASAKKHYPIAFNLLPQIDVFEDDGYTHEEWKMIHETKKILYNDQDSQQIKVTATCVRVPVEIGHGETVYFVLKDKSVTAAAIQQEIKKTPGLVLQDDPQNQIYPQPLLAAGKKETFVGRIRPDQENPGAFNMWVVADNLLRGAASNTVEIAECLVRDNLVHVPK
ncbi:Aspartate-semialdehyde dehydrogenase [Lactobacillus helsingborgensis]|uniref:Aspartate-semialdehyde dehydrogenase n=1 Tax=Lactobacillus helsingborgensis TaxID=1218494 RepID=A0AA47GGU0_9LACO|nr:aspartate-semialdehyde dehydrogenase [Lactobacillus helsingborgensis]KJY63118.1 Aspartate-semialdehyde dehydrogenase [Lactobacillus helsingborgensis]UZX29590.1 aspartate-semialdehyde dehydrogenase [Lactobacillus helsingborgensis]